MWPSDCNNPGEWKSPCCKQHLTSGLLCSPRPRQSLSSLAAAVKELEEIPAYLPNGAALKDAVQKAKDWLQEVEALQVCESGCWGGTVTLLMSPEPSHTPCILQGSSVTLIQSTQSGTLR